MSGRGAGGNVRGATCGPSGHVPVLLSEVLAALAPADGEVIVDGTFGAGGYTTAILQAADCQVVAIDRDPDAAARAALVEHDFPSRLRFIEGRFGEMDRLLADNGIEAVDAVVLDIGVSSMQLDEPERGFSFIHDGPLDMRMARRGLSAADVVNHYKEADLARIIAAYGEERRARIVARAICAERAVRPLMTTLQLADLVASILGRPPGSKIHPATRTFQALRIYVNRELDELAYGLAAAERLLRPGGRLAVVTFHSLEDRIVKQFLARRSSPAANPSRHLPQGEAQSGFAPSFSLIHRKTITPGQDEQQANPRARSSRLRAAVRLDAPTVPLDRKLMKLPQMPDHER